MHPALRDFVRQYIAVAAFAAAPAVLAAFVGMPWALGRHPGEPVIAQVPAASASSPAPAPASGTPTAAA